MSRSLERLLRGAEELLALEPEDLGGVILEILNNPPIKPFRPIDLYRDLTDGMFLTPAAPVREAIGEALQWLLSERLIAVLPPEQFPIEERLFVTRRGRLWQTRDDLAKFRQSAMLPSQILHPKIEERCKAPFLRADYDAAVFQAYKAIEVEVRKVAGLADDLIGQDLMVHAFKPSKGVLADTTELAAEQQALMNLFTGAIGYFKNPHSHREEPLDPVEASHLLVFASNLLSIVDTRALNRPRAQETP